MIIYNNPLLNILSHYSLVTTCHFFFDSCFEKGSGILKTMSSHAKDGNF